MKRLLLILLFVTGVGISQDADAYYYYMGNYRWWITGAVTETNGAIGNYHLITGSITETETVKNSGSLRSDPYMRWWLDSADVIANGDMEIDDNWTGWLEPDSNKRSDEQAHGGTIRPIMKVEFQLAGRKLKQEFTIADRSHMKFEVLIGQNALKKGFLIDPNIK